MKKVTFKATFPFAAIELTDSKVPLRVNIEAWSPFIPTDADNSSLPVGSLECTFVNTSGRNQEYTFTHRCENFLASRLPKDIKGVGSVVGYWEIIARY